MKIYDERRFLSWAKRIGENTSTVITGIINFRQVIQQAYPACMALLSLSKTYGEQRLEEVCTQIVQEGLSLSFTNVKNMLAALSSPQPPVYSQPPTKKRRFLREPSYFEQAAKREGKHDQKRN